jgi:metal-dependent amidase/aminoacylase/carboxypeptidase family protein
VLFQTAEITAAAFALQDRVTTHRRTLHRTPELAFAEHRTASYIEGVLDELGVAHRRVVGTGDRDPAASASARTWTRCRSSRPPDGRATAARSRASRTPAAMTGTSPSSWA